MIRACCFLLQALPYVALLIVMMFFIYAVIGMQVRCKVRKSGSNFHCFEHFFALCFFLFFKRDGTQVMGKIMRVFPTQLKSALFQYLLLAPQTELSRLQNRAEILVLGHHLCTRIWLRAVIGLLRMLLSICQSGWREMWNAFPVILESVEGPQQGSRRCFADVTNRG